MKLYKWSQWWLLGWHVVSFPGQLVALLSLPMASPVLYYSLERFSASLMAKKKEREEFKEHHLVITWTIRRCFKYFYISCIFCKGCLCCCLCCICFRFMNSFLSTTYPFSICILNQYLYCLVCFCVPTLVWQTHETHIRCNLCTKFSDIF